MSQSNSECRGRSGNFARKRTYPFVWVKQDCKIFEFREQSRMCRVIMLLYNISKTFTVSLEEIVILELKDRGVFGLITATPV